MNHGAPPLYCPLNQFALVVLAAATLAALPPAQARADDAAWMRARMAELVAASRGELPGGRAVFYADGDRHYNLIYTRGFGYVHAWAGELLEPADVRGFLEYLLAGQRADGCVPDRVNSAGRAIYSPGAEGHPLADHALDNAQFLAAAVCRYAADTGDHDFFRRHEPALRRGLDFIRRADDGLVFSDPDNPQCVYGFTDIVQKTGRLLFSSVLYYDACRRMAEACAAAGCGEPGEYARRAERIRENLGVLWDAESGGYWAAERQCRQLDVWGTAFVLHHRLATPQQERRALDFLVANYGRYAERGQIRHLLAPETWEATFTSRPPGVYQNGGYWATPLSWFVPVLERRDPDLARRTLDACLADFRERGINEWVNGDVVTLRNYLVSAASVYSLVRDAPVDATE